MVSAMTSYSSWRHGAFLFLGNIRLKAISNSHQWPKHSWRPVFSSSAKQCLLSVNLKPILMQTEQQTRTPNCQSSQGKIWHRKILWSEERRLEIQRRKQQRWMEMVATNSGAERTSLNEFQMLKFFKSKWKRFWIISLINIWANIAVTKHVLLADEFVPYRPRLLGFYSLDVNAMKCIHVGFSPSKLQSFFWKISLNSCLMRLEGLNNKNSIELCVCSTLSSGKAFARCTEGSEFESGP